MALGRDDTVSKEALTTVIQRALTDPTFRRSLVMDPTALGAFDLTDSEAAALRSGDPSRLTAFGIDQRMSKIFMVDPGSAGASVTAGIGNEPRDVEPYWVGGSSEAVTAGNGTDEGQLIPGSWTEDTTDAVTGGAGNEPRDVEPTDISGTLGGGHGDY